MTLNNYGKTTSSLLFLVVHFHSSKQWWIKAFQYNILKKIWLFLFIFHQLKHHQQVFGGTVVFMRSMTARNAIRPVEVTSRFPCTHGSPIHFGDPNVIDTKDISKPDWGDVQHIADDETPVFWSYGVTPQNATRIVKPELCITQYPGKHVDYRFNESAWHTIKRLTNKIKTHS